MSSTPSSRRSRGHSARKSQSSTPIQQSQGTPSRATGQGNGAAIASSSPVFFQSSPKSTPQQQASQRSQDGMIISSPPRQASSVPDRDATPRASRQAATESSPVRYDPSSSPQRNTQQNRTEIPTSSSGMFVRQDGPSNISSRRGDIHSDTFGSTPSQRRRIYVGEDGMPMREEEPGSEATFSNLNPGTSEADVMGGDSTRVIWGTNISVTDTMATFKNFLYNYARKYRMWADGKTEDETNDLGPAAGQKEYLEMINMLRKSGMNALNLDARNLKSYPATLKLWHQLQAYPQEIIPIMDQGLKDVALDLANQEMQDLQRAAAGRPNAPQARNGSSVPPAPSSDIHSDGPNTATPSAPAEVRDLVYDVERRPLRIMPFGLDRTVNMRELDPADIDKLVSIKGLVIRSTPVIPDMKEAYFKCSVCGHALMSTIDRGKITEPQQCPRVPCASKNCMEIVHNRCTFADKQVIKLQETPDAVPDGQTPHSVSLCVYDELVDVCKAGDRIEVTGIFRSNPVRVNPRQRTIKSLFKTYIDVLHIKKSSNKRLGNDASTIEQDLSEHVAGDSEQTRKITKEEEEKIKATAARDDVYEILSRSLAPSLWEMDDVKKGILLQLFGGTNKSFDKGGSPKYRGDINILLCGDPSTAKSQILQYVHKIAPRGVYTSGKGSSAVGLTAYVTRDPESKQLVLESGALVLSDGGVCCIDEFDKMTDSTRSVLHEVMEQQTVSIAKAGIITTLNARTSILASANPIGSKYNPNLPVPQNIDLPPTLLSRFDLVYLVLDNVDEATDRKLAKHLVSMYIDDKPQNASEEEVLPTDLLTAYISYARLNIHPVLTPAAGRALSDAYVAMRNMGSSLSATDRRITATTRQLESMIRLSEAHAKMRLAEIVEVSDVEEAVRLIKSAIKASATDARTGLIDMGLLSEGQSSSDRKRKEDLKREVVRLLDGDDRIRSGGEVRYSDLYRRMSEGNSGGDLEGVEFGDALRALEQEGRVMILGEGAARRVRRVTGQS